MYDHIGLSVRDITVSEHFYEAVLTPLGHRLCDRGEEYVGFGPEGAPLFLLYSAPAALPGQTHVGFKAAKRSDVDQFYRNGLENGGRDHGAPGLRPQYGEGYYAAFLLDPDGNNIEAVCVG
jgi:catechol 2,3-dioxygenase-like lactoylglutathione lyase family enzyme